MMRSNDGRPDSCAPPLDTRLVVFDLRGPDRPSAGTGALAVVGGLPILGRTLLVLARKGIRHALLIVEPQDRPLVAAALTCHPRLAMDVRWAEDEGPTLEPAARAVEASGAEVVYWPGRLTFGLAVPAIVTLGVPGDGLVVERLDPPQAESGLVLMGPRVLADYRHLSMPALLAACSAAGRVTLTAPTSPALTVTSTADAAEAESRLLRSLRKSLDGVFAQYDRGVSLWISSRLMKYPVAPNHVTVVAGVIGLMSGLLAARGGYGWLLAGAASYLLSNIIDGVDGEIARAKLLESRLGEWLDTVVDDGGSLVFAVGTAVGAYRTWHSEVYLLLGAVSAFGILASSAIMYHHLVTVAHSGDLLSIELPWKEHNTTGWMSRFLAFVRPLTRRDAVCYLSFGWALIGQARATVWMVAAGATGAWMTLAAFKMIVPAMKRRT